MRRFTTAIVVFFVAAGLTHGQDWTQVRREDEAKWAQRTGLTPFTVHQLWRMASVFADANDDDSRIEELDFISDTKQVLLVTSSGDPTCLALTVFSKLPRESYQKVWREQQTPSGAGFCDNAFGDVTVRFNDGMIDVSVPEADNKLNPKQTDIAIYSYTWRRGTYGFAGLRRSTVSPGHPKRRM